MKTVYLKWLLLIFLAFPAALNAGQTLFCAVPDYDIFPLSQRESISVKNYGAKGDGITDDTAAIQNALDKVPSGSVLLFPKGNYIHSASLKLSRNNIIIQGENAVLQARTPYHQILELKGDRTAVLGMTFKGVTGKRDGRQLESSKIKITGDWVQFAGNTIDTSAGAGIFVYGAKNFRIKGNIVMNTVADGIHMTNSARHGLVEKNIVKNTGDDMIAVVSYGLGIKNLSGNILIKNNMVEGNYWGRGITVVGGENIAIVKNSVANVKMAAGIMIAQEASYKTGSVENILVAHNTIKNIQLPSKTGESIRYTHQAAIDINTSEMSPVEYIEVLDNYISASGFGGIRVLGNACHIKINNNQIRIVGLVAPSSSVAVARNNCTETISYDNNIADGKPLQLNHLTTEKNNWTAEKDGLFDNMVWQNCP